MINACLNPPHTRSRKPASRTDTAHIPPRSMDDLLREVQDQFESQLHIDSLLALSKKLQAELRQHLVASPQCMLPSFNYNLPTGQERGTFLALEVGGSNLRMALVELRGRNKGRDCMHIRRTASSPIDMAVRQLKEYAFFDWMAERIKEMLGLERETRDGADHTKPLRMGVAWSFPIELVKYRPCCCVQPANVEAVRPPFEAAMYWAWGRAFTVPTRSRGTILAISSPEPVNVRSEAPELFGKKECTDESQNINVRLDAIVNDSSSALLARAYADPATRLAVILGTGMNAAVHLPIASLHPSKFASRTPPKATHVLTNTEFSMLGKNIFPTTRWDETLNARHILPDYQPFEYLIAGGYISEIVRLILVEATETAGLFGGALPSSLRNHYILDTRTLALIDIDTSPALTSSQSLLQERHPSSNGLTFADAKFIRQISRAVTRRSVAYFTAGVHALSSLLEDLEAHAGLQNDLDHVSIGCDGSVINKYPGYMDTAQETLDRLRERENGGRKRVILEKTQESAVLGAGVAGALAAAFS